MNIINFINPNLVSSNKKAHSHLVHCAISGYMYAQASQELKDHFNTYVPEDQYDAFKLILDIQMNLDLGPRNKELQG